MTFLHHLNGTLGYGAIGSSSCSPWLCISWRAPPGPWLRGPLPWALAAAFVGQREITASVQHQLDEQKTAYSQLETRQAELNLRPDQRGGQGSDGRRRPHEPRFRLRSPSPMPNTKRS